jgi:hypothetical protein
VAAYWEAAHDSANAGEQSRCNAARGLLRPSTAGAWQRPAGFLFSLIASLFVDVRIYAYPNSGWWYDLGFILGVMAFYGSGTRTYTYTYRRWR